jgi:hypothetical protein
MKAVANNLPYYDMAKITAVKKFFSEKITFVMTARVSFVLGPML